MADDVLHGAALEPDARQRPQQRAVLPCCHALRALQLPHALQRGVQVPIEPAGPCTGACVSSPLPPLGLALRGIYTIFARCCTHRALFPLIEYTPYIYRYKREFIIPLIASPSHHTHFRGWHDSFEERLRPQQQAASTRCTISSCSSTLLCNQNGCKRGKHREELSCSNDFSVCPIDIEHV